MSTKLYVGNLGFGTTDAQVRDAFEEFGFAGVRGHGIPDATIASALASARAFFELPDDVKLKYAIAGGAGQRGYTPFRIEKAKDQSRPDLKEFWHVGREVPRDHPLAHALLPNAWPVEIAGFRTAQLALFAALERLGAMLDGRALNVNIARERGEGGGGGGGSRGGRERSERRW